MKNQSIDIINIFKTAVHKSEPKSPYLIAYVICALYFAIIFINNYASYKAFGLPFKDFLQLSYSEIIHVNTTGTYILSAVQVMYAILLLPIIQIGTPWLGARSAKGIHNSSRDCFKLMHFYLEILGATFLFRALLFLIMHLILHKMSIGHDFIISTILAPFYVFVFLHITADNHEVVESCIFSLKVFVKHFFKIFLFNLIIIFINILGLLTLIGWIWTAPITSRAWGLIYTNLAQS